MLQPPFVGADDAQYIDALLTALLVDLVAAARSDELAWALMDFVPLFLSHSFEKSIMFAALGGNFAFVSMLTRLKSSRDGLMRPLDITRFLLEILSAVTTGYYWQCSCRSRSDTKLFCSDSVYTDKDQLTDDELLSTFCSSHLSLHYMHLLSAMCLSNRAELVITGCRMLSRLVEIDQVNAVAIEVAGGLSALMSIVSRELHLRPHARDASWILSVGASTMLDPSRSPAGVQPTFRCGYTASASLPPDSAAHEFAVHAAGKSPFAEEESVRVLSAALHTLRQLDAVLSREGRDDAVFALCRMAEGAIDLLNEPTEEAVRCPAEKNTLFVSTVCGSLSKTVVACDGLASNRTAKCCICLSAPAIWECIHES
jgi:hypothetical protein